MPTQCALLDRLGPHDTLGDYAISHGVNHHCSAICKDDTRALYLCRTDFMLYIPEGIKGKEQTAGIRGKQLTRSGHMSFSF